MTKPMNFPERKRQRQLSALARLKTLRPNTRRLAEIKTLEQQTTTSKRSVFTKKYRGD